MRFALAFVAASLFSACVVTPNSQGPGPMAPTGPGPATPTGALPVGPSGNLLPYNGPLACNGTEDLVIENADINLNGPGIAVNGACTISVRNSRIVAHGAPAVVVSGSGDIVMSNSYVAGQPPLIISGSGTIQVSQSQIDGDIFISGSGDINLQGSLLHGHPTVTGSGSVNDGGGNQWQ